MALNTRWTAAIALAALITAGCGTAAIAPDHARLGSSLQAHSDSAPKDKDAFLAELKKRSIKLSAADLATLTKERSLVPSGEFADRPAAKLTGPENLAVHFKKHGHEFKPAIKSEEAYVESAIAAATGKRGEVRFFFDTTSFSKGYQSHIVRWVPKTKEFTAFRADGAMTTYYLNFKVGGSRFIEVPLLD